MNNNDIIKSYLDQYPNLANMTLAKKIYNENKIKFTTLEYVRERIRYYRGACGLKKLQTLKTDKYLNQEKLEKKYNLPKSIKQKYKPYKIIGNRGLIFADVHIPFQNNDAIETMFNYTINKNLDFIIILGDLIDCFDISSFNKEPNKVRLRKEIELAKKFLQELTRIYPKAKIYYKFGNHCKRYDTYLINHAPELYDISEIKLNVLLDLYNLGINYIEEERYIDLMGLYLLHGHEMKRSIINPINAARGLYLRTKTTSLVAHFHQKSEHPAKTISGKIQTCWSIGCLCQLNPKWLPINDWENGFALYERYDHNYWGIDNKKIIKNRVV